MEKQIIEELRKDSVEIREGAKGKLRYTVKVYFDDADKAFERLVTLIKAAKALCEAQGTQE